MTHFTRIRLAGFLLVCSSLLAVSVAQAQNWSSVGGEFQGGVIRGLYVPALSSTSATGDSWAAVYSGGMFRQVSGSSTWTPMNTGLDNKRVYGFALATGASPYRGYVATLGGGVYRTVDGGANWTAVNKGLGCVYVRSVQYVGIAAAGGAPATTGVGATEATDRLLASTDCGSDSGVYLSTDGGANWTLTSGMLPGVLVNGVTRVNPNNSGVDFLVAATYDGPYKSIDNGLNWTSLNDGVIAGPQGIDINNVAFLYNAVDGLALFATEAGTGVWKSTDQGATWGAAPVLSKIATSGVFTDGNANGNLYFPADGEGIHISADRGANWTLFASDTALPGARGIIRNTTAAGLQEFQAQTFAGIYKSGDGGVTWNKASTGLPGGYSINLAADASGNTYVAAAEGVYKSAPGGGAFQRLGGSNLGIFFSGGHVVVTPADVVYAITSHQGVFRYDGANWVAKNVGVPPISMYRQGSQLRIDPRNANGLYLGLSNGGMYLSADGGETWTAKNVGLVTPGARNIRHIAVTPAYVVVATNDGIYKSTDSGAAWTRLAFPAKGPTNLELSIDHVRIDSGSGNIYAAVYHTSAAGITYPDSGIWKSTDAGATWTQSLKGTQAHDISLARNASGVTLYAGLWDAVGGGAMQSTDEGLNWTPMNAGLTSNYIGSFGISGGILKGVATLGEGVFSFTPAVTAEALNIVPGWNLLGNGVSASVDVATVFGGLGKVTTVWKWLAAPVNKWAFYTPGMRSAELDAYALSKGYEVLKTIAGGEGFWVNASAPFTQPLAGTALTASSFQSTLGAGWSLIATGDRKTPSAFNRISNATPATPGVVPNNLTTLWAWDAAKANWYFYAPSLEASGGLFAYVISKSYLDFADRALDPTTGFWVNKP